MASVCSCLSSSTARLFGRRTKGVAIHAQGVLPTKGAAAEPSSDANFPDVERNNAVNRSSTSIPAKTRDTAIASTKTATATAVVAAAGSGMSAKEEGLPSLISKLAIEGVAPEAPCSAKKPPLPTHVARGLELAGVSKGEAGGERENVSRDDSEWGTRSDDSDDVNGGRKKLYRRKSTGVVPSAVLAGRIPVAPRWSLDSGSASSETRPSTPPPKRKRSSSGGRRRSTAQRKSVIRADMAEDLQQAAVDCAARAMDIFDADKDIAAYIKKEFDEKHGTTWHCIVGQNFGSYVTHEANHFVYLSRGKLAVLLFKAA